jgi:hypothetical protein
MLSPEYPPEALHGPPQGDGLLVARPHDQRALNGAVTVVAALAERSYEFLAVSDYRQARRVRAEREVIAGHAAEKRVE